MADNYVIQRDDDTYWTVAAGHGWWGADLRAAEAGTYTRMSRRLATLFASHGPTLKATLVKVAHGG